MIALLVLLLLVAEPLPYACGPYLLLPGVEQMTVVIDHNLPITAELVYGIEGEDGEQRVAHAAVQRHHVFTLSGLQPGTRYWYEVRTGTQLASGKRSFRTLPAKPDSYQVIVLGDVRSLPQRWHAVSQRIFQQEQDALFVIGTGDYPADGSKYALWRKQFFEPARNLLASKPMWPAIGNHEMTRRHDDLTRPEASRYFSLFELPGNERWYRVDYHLMTLLVLDSNSRLSPEHEQYQWLRQQLRTERKRFTLVAFHHAPFSSGPHAAIHPDATPKEWPLDEGRRFLVPLFEMYGVDVVLNGHDHLYERSEKDGIPYIVTGGGGAPLYKINSAPNPYQLVAKSTNHYVRLDVSKDGIDLNAIDTIGTVIDSARFVPKKDNLIRRAHHVGKRVQMNFTTGKPELAKLSLSCTARNPLDHPMTLQVTMQEGAWKSPPVTIALPPGASKTVDVALAPLVSPAPKPWQTFRTGTLTVVVAGQEEALPINFIFTRRIELAVPRYQLQNLDRVQLDGVATEWTGIPAMRIGAQQPVPRGVANYAGVDDFEADLRLAVSSTMLHLFVDVRDPDFVDSGKGSYFLNDSCNLVLQAPRWQRQAAIPTVIAFGASGRANQNVAHRVKRRDGGYSIEASIPLAATPFAQRNEGPLEVQFEVVLVDQDPGQGPSLHRLWTNHLRANVADYGSLRVIAK
ncbi:MAG: hypothetical protein ACI9S9_004304 [Planctomycetota bacterium]|jgi:hypothetical protein